MVALPVKERKMSAKSTLSRWVDDYVKGLLRQNLPVVLPLVTDAAMDFFRGDEEFIKSLFNELVRNQIYTVAQQTVGQTRNRNPGVTYIEHGQMHARREIVMTAIARKAPKWMNWMEHTNGQQKALSSMTKSDLEDAANEREQRGNRELELARLWRLLASQLSGDTTVGDKYTDVQIEMIYLSLKEQAVSNAQT